MQFEYDPENLIQVVKKRPGIWDYDHPDYREKRTRMELWNEVVQELMDTDVKMNKSDMRELELQLQKKWKSLRDCFQKYMSNPQKSKRPYIYSKHLQFLLKDQKPMKRSPFPTISAKEDSVEEEDDRKPRWRPKKKLKLSTHDELSDEEDSNVFVETLDDSDDYSAKATPSSSQVTTHNDSGQFAFASVDTVHKESEDPDKMFLMSLLPHLKSIPEEFRLNAKMELMQVLQQANLSIAKLM